MARSKETEQAIAILMKAGAREATPEEYAKEAGTTRLTYRPGMRAAKFKASRWFRKSRF